jgi:hypothetical protein
MVEFDRDEYAGGRVEDYKIKIGTLASVPIFIKQDILLQLSQP